MKESIGLLQQTVNVIKKLSNVTTGRDFPTMASPKKFVMTLLVPCDKQMLLTLHPRDILSFVQIKSQTLIVTTHKK